MEVQGQLKDALVQIQRQDRNVVIDIDAAKCSYQNIDIAAAKCSYQNIDIAAKENVLIKPGVGPEQGVVRLQADPALTGFPFCLHWSLVGRPARHWQAER